MFEGLKLKKQKRVMKRLIAKKRVRTMHNFDSIKKVGIIFNVTTEERWNLINNIAKVLEKYGKKVFMLGVIDKKDTKLNFIITNPKVTLIRKKGDLNCWGIPKKSKLKPFFKRKYNTLINISNVEDFVTSYLSVKTLADVKIALDTDENQKIYDVLIKMNPDSSEEDFMKQVIHYLTLINK